jgi:hypothetical protein
MSLEILKDSFKLKLRLEIGRVNKPFEGKYFVTLTIARRVRAPGTLAAEKSAVLQENGEGSAELASKEEKRVS